MSSESSLVGSFFNFIITNCEEYNGIDLKQIWVTDFMKKLKYSKHNFTKF